MPQILSTNGFFLEGFLVSCTFDYFSRDLTSRLLLFYMVIFGFIVPIFVITFSYIKLYTLVKTKKSNEMIQLKYSICINLQEKLNTLNKAESLELEEKPYVQRFIQEKKMASLENKWTTVNIDKVHINKRFKTRRDAIKTNSIISKPRDFLLEREIKVAKVILIKVIFFCAAWTPYVIVILLTQFGNNIEKYITPKTTSLPSLFAKTSIVFNALIYTLTQKDCSCYYYNLFFFKKKSDLESVVDLQRRSRSRSTNCNLENLV